MTDLDRYTKDELARMSVQAAAVACEHYARAAALVGLSAKIPYTDQARFDAYQEKWKAAMAAGNEQEELCQAIGLELRMRAVCDA